MPRCIIELYKLSSTFSDDYTVLQVYLWSIDANSAKQQFQVMSFNTWDSELNACEAVHESTYLHPQATCGLCPMALYFRELTVTGTVFSGRFTHTMSNARPRRIAVMNATTLREIYQNTAIIRDAGTAAQVPFYYARSID
jgi:hypothetical protein